MVLKSKQTRSKKDKKIDLVSEDVVDNSSNEVSMVAAEMENIGKTLTNITFMIEELDAKKKLENFEKSLETNNSKDTTESLENSKKRGRKPKGGKLYSKTSEKVNSVNQVSNIILHLKCSVQDIESYNNKLNHIVTDPLLYNPEVPPNIMSYTSEPKISFSEYNIDEQLPSSEEKYENDIIKPAYKEFENFNNKYTNQYCSSCSSKLEQDECVENYDEEEEDDGLVNLKDINQKLKKIKINLYKNANPEKKSACFWCTYDYDNPPCYIPKYEMNGEIFGYGSFCRPECAVAYLMRENIDDSTKFERYHLLNQMYSRVYNFKKNIKPAPNPYFLLEKYYGNLTIQEYRKLLKTEHMLLVIEKPMTRILPELHEDNEEFTTNIYGGKVTSTTNTSGVYKVKKSTDKPKGPSKSTIIKENFGFS